MVHQCLFNSIHYLSCKSFLKRMALKWNDFQNYWICLYWSCLVCCQSFLLLQSILMISRNLIRARFENYLTKSEYALWRKFTWNGSKICKHDVDIFNESYLRAFYVLLTLDHTLWNSLSILACESHACLCS
mgnify:CR=1 FL=1